ncbi:MAG: ATP-dependent helicase [Deltaproteobacteria bacterium]|jgi:DNA helicase-2/ATP-dependent DNA helicase PcrA|nr:ATP-dependent helicase [Deltaproteobacteria bacterium]
MLDISSLNPNQLAAVNWAKGPLLVLAGPGSGKTRVLTHRMAKILEESTGQHFRLLALTFTNKAAGEMRTRVEELVPKELGRVRLTTFHSFAAEILQKHGSHNNIRPDFQIIGSELDRDAFLKEALNELQRDAAFLIPPDLTRCELLPIMTQLLDQCVPTSNLQKIFSLFPDQVYAQPIAKIYKAYREALHRANTLDFSSLITECVELLTNFPSIATQIRKIYHHILVDEFQDTNSAQYTILSLLAAPNYSTLFVVADDDQIIYQWNGASIERINDLKKDFPISVLQLPENYRCPKEVIQLANALIEHNPVRTLEKMPSLAIKINCPDQSAQIVRVQGFADLNQECAWIARDIEARSVEERAQCAVLARTKRLLYQVGKLLILKNIPVYYTNRNNEFNSPPFTMLHSILRLVNSKEDKISLSRLLNSFYKLEGIFINQDNVIANSYADGKDLLRSWLDIVLTRTNIKDSTRSLLTTDIKPLLQSLNFQKFTDSLINWAITKKNSKNEDFNYYNRYNDFSDFNDELIIWNDFLSDITSKFAPDEISLYQLLHELDLTYKSPPKQKNAVSCLTIHGSKGLEFGHVYLMGLVEDHLPIWQATQSGDDSIELQEERRSCFVAITRTQQTLTMTFSNRYFTFLKEPSRFLNEMGLLQPSY